MENRVIKFRAWDGDKIIYQSEDGWFDKVKHPEYQSPQCMKFASVMRVCKIMQFTGLTDKNGVDGYEKDFVMESRVGLPNELIGIVKYDTDLCAFIVEKTNGGVEYLGKHMTDNPRHVFFGNIYENPELLNP